MLLLLAPALVLATNETWNTCLIGQLPCVIGCIQAIPSSECPPQHVTADCAPPRGRKNPCEWTIHSAPLARAQATLRTSRSTTCASATPVAAEELPAEALLLLLLRAVRPRAVPPPPPLLLRLPRLLLLLALISPLAPVELELVLALAPAPAPALALALPIPGPAPNPGAGPIPNPAVSPVGLSPLPSPISPPPPNRCSRRTARSWRWKAVELRHVGQLASLPQT